MADAKIKTSQLALVLETVKDGTKTWNRVRKQTSLSIAYDAQTTEEAYIDQEASTTEIDSYNVSTEGELVAYQGDPVFDYIDGLRRAKATGTDAQTRVAFVYLYDKASASTNSYNCEWYNCSIQYTSFGGDGGGGAATLAYTISCNGDPTKATCTIGEDGAITIK